MSMSLLLLFLVFFFFFFNDTATTEIYTTRHTLSLHDALPSSGKTTTINLVSALYRPDAGEIRLAGDPKSTRLNSSHALLPRMPSSACKKKHWAPVALILTFSVSLDIAHLCADFG